MNANRKKQVVLLLLVVVIAGLMAVMAGGAAAQNGPPNPPVLPPHSSAFGMTYEEWAAKFWQWAASVPAGDEHPLFADGEMDCSVGQEGKVWFLGGTYSESGIADRTCEVPTGKALFFPIVNVLCSPFTGDDPDTLIQCASDPPAPPFKVVLAPVEATIDGVIFDQETLENYYTLSKEPFTLGPLPENNIFSAEKDATGPGATGGYYLLLPPLSKGKHDISFIGEIQFFDAEGNYLFTVFHTEISYSLTVVGR
jgi:hypothetical protein